MMSTINIYQFRVMIENSISYAVSEILGILKWLEREQSALTYSTTLYPGSHTYPTPDLQVSKSVTNVSYKYHGCAISPHLLAQWPPYSSVFWVSAAMDIPPPPAIHEAHWNECIVGALVLFMVAHETLSHTVVDVY